MHLPRKKRTRFTIALATALLIAGAIAFGVAISADPPESGPAVHSHSEHADIWSVNVETRELTQQTLNADAREPSWSPDGELAFSTAPCDECYSEIHLDGSGSTEQPVETTVRHVYQPSWAPDGNRFAVVRLGRGIWSVDVATSTAEAVDERARRTRHRPGPRTETGSRSTGSGRTRTTSCSPYTPGPASSGA